MPPKGVTGAARPQHARKPSTVNPGADRDPASAKVKAKGKEKEGERDRGKRDNKDSMLPPPPPPKPLAFLEPELEALEESLKNTTVTTAQIFRFYADTKRLGVQRHAPRPPRSLTSTLEHELGRYDQICDTLEAHLTRAIAVLQRDLTREEDRIRKEEAEKARLKAVETARTVADVEMTGVTKPSSEAGVKPQQAMVATGTVTGTGKIPLRRPSKISLSTLHRSPFSLKLDLSSASLRLGTDEGGLDMSALGNLSALGSLGSMGVGGISGLASPVTLAPRSARPMGPGELPPDVLAALASASGQNIHIPNSSQHVDIDLTLEDDLQGPSSMGLLGAGNSVDKPIELDLDLDVHMSDLTSGIFGEQASGGIQQSGPSSSTNVDDLFGPGTSSVPTSSGTNDPASMDMSMLLSENQGHDNTLFASLGADNNGPNEGTSDVQSGADAGPNEGDGEGAAFDYSQLRMFFNDAPNQEEIDMMEHLLKLDESGEGGEASGSSSSAAPPAVA